MSALPRTLASIVIALCETAAQAQGIPVIDIANLIQTLMQVMNDVTKISNQVEQIRQLEAQVTSLKNCYLGKEEHRAFRFRW